MHDIDGTELPQKVSVRIVKVYTNHKAVILYR